jgi:hypothetical protein
MRNEPDPKNSFHGGIFLLLWMGLFPPYSSDKSDVIVDIYYYCVFIPPPEMKIDFSRYLPWMGIILVLTAGLMFLLRDRK